MVETIRQLLEWIKNGLEVLAAWTPSDIDDQLVKLINAVLANDMLLQWLADLLGTIRSQSSNASAAEQMRHWPLSELRAVAQQAGIDWGQLISKLLPLLLDLLRRWLEAGAGGGGASQVYEPSTTPRC